MAWVWVRVLDYSSNRIFHALFIWLSYCKGIEKLNQGNLQQKYLDYDTIADQIFVILFTIFTILPSVFKSSLLGFFNPCLNQDKKLLIRYRCREVVYDTLFDDLDKRIENHPDL